MGEIEERADGSLGLQSLQYALLRVGIRLSVGPRIAPSLLVCRAHIAFGDAVGRFDVGPEGRVGQDDVEPALKDAVDVDEPVVVMHAAVAVAVHDHVHLAGAGHAVVGVAPVDAAVGQLPEAGILGVLIDGGAALFVLLAEQFGALGL